MGGCPLTKERVASYSVIDENNKSQYSFLKGAIGTAIFGGLGLLAGIGGKKKKEYLILIEWADYPSNPEQRSLIFIDDRYYKEFVRAMF